MKIIIYILIAIFLSTIDLYAQQKALKILLPSRSDIKAVNDYFNRGCVKYLKPHKKMHQNMFADKEFLVSQNKYIKKPPINLCRVTSEIIGGAATGVGLAYLGLKIYNNRSIEETVGIICAGYITGNAIGVYIIGNLGDETGSFLSTLLGSLSGILIGQTIARALKESWITPIGPPVFATIGFNVSRRQRSISEPQKALINFKSNTASFAIPILYFRYNCYNQKPIKTIDLIRLTL